jgi:serine/threonine-protein kinase CHEK1
MTVTTVDKRKMQLIFKASPIEMDGKILVNFRLSKGCGLDFKRIFVDIKDSLSNIIAKGLVTWPIAIATNTVP